MSNAETPAEQTGPSPATPDASTLASIPPRIRVHALAKLFGKTSKQLLATLGELGQTARSAQSSVSREVALKVAETYGVSTEVPATPTMSAAPAETETAAPPAQPPGRAPQQAGAEPAISGLPSAPLFASPTPVFLPPEPVAASKAETTKSETTKSETGKQADGGKKATGDQAAPEAAATGPAEDADSGEDDEDASARRRRRRGRRGRGRGKGSDEGRDGSGDQQDDGADGDATAAGEGAAASGDQRAEADEQDSGGGDSGDASSRRRRRRRRRKGGGGDDGTNDDPPDTVVHVRDSGRAESSKDQVRSVRGSTRLEAKRQRRRDGREAGRRRAPILSEAEFLARRESVDRTMIVKENNASADRTTQIGVLEDGVLVEHFVTSSGSGSIVGNVYLGRVQNVLPSMEAAFVDIGRGRNAVLYAGEVDWDAAGLEGKSRKIEQALSTGDPVLVQVTKDPVGHKGARLTTQISLPGRFLVYVPGGGATGISRKLPENERRRLKDILKQIVPEDAGVIIRTASEGISADELERDVRRLQSQWDTIKQKSGKGQNGKAKKAAPTLLYEEPDLLVKVVRDLFTEDFSKLVVQGSIAWETIDSYVQSVAPDLADRLDRYVGTGDVFRDFRIDEQITKALDRKVWLPSGGYLVIDRTEAMTVIDVNTGKFTGSGGNLEETVTRNNLESAEEIVRQLRLRDIGGIIVIDFIDMVLESNRDLVLRRLTECLSRDRTRHQVAEVTSLGLVQMTRKRVGTGLIEAYSTSCEHCKGRGVVISTEPRQGGADTPSQQQGRKRGRGKGDESVPVVPEPTPEQRETVASAVAAMASASKVATAKDEPKADKADKAGKAGKVTEPKAEEPKAEEPKAEEPKAPKKTRVRAVRPKRPAGPPEPTVEPREPAAAAVAPASQPAETTEAPAPAEPVTPAVSGTAGPQGDGSSGGAAEAGVADEAAAADKADKAGEAGEQAVPEVPEVPVPAVRTVRKRPRRAASRPAGPPVGATSPAGSASEPSGGSAVGSSSNTDDAFRAF
ncbi:MAG: Rne/Rng family ribonuclease [Actinophytocola sp.]|nr:Rne/Rng family ribonuclease [Actinophytocola sp.]